MMLPQCAFVRKGIEMLYLGEEDIRRAVTYEDMLGAVEEAFDLFTTGQCTMIDRTIASRGGLTMLYMPCFAGDYVSTKILASCPENPARGLPALDGVVLLNRADTGVLEAVLDGGTVTALRTGAVGGLAARHLAPEDAHSAGLVGCGVQGLHQLAFLCAVRDIRTIYLRQTAGRDLSGFLRRLREMIAPRQAEIVLCPDGDAVLKNSEILVTATPSRTPLFSDDPALFRDKCILAIGSWQPDMREIPDAVWSAAEAVYTELPFACEESGDLSQPLAAGILTPERVRYFGAYLAEKRAGSVPAPRGTQYFKSVGMGVFDTVAARVILEKVRGKRQ